MEDYLKILGVEAREPGLEALTELVRAQLITCPFENISKLYHASQGARFMPTREVHLAGIQQHRFGGTCYANNYYFFRLLEALGYNVRICGAAMSDPDVHTVILLDLEGREYLVDVGYAAPFYAPLPTDVETEIRWGEDAYLLHPKEGLRLDHLRAGKRIHGYLVNPRPRPLEHFTDVIAASYQEDATFLNAVRLVRFDEQSSVSIFNHQVTFEDENGATRSDLPDRAAIEDAVVEFSEIPRAIVQQALAHLKELRGIHD